ncbi:E3 protein [Raptor adenovirus 1]|uniref:E3 protein n=1 Tax=Raptor adenovirus 1 TaxID=1520002 RepID=F4MI09_9ADEN|nr:E3 protein [Raptor adenovirus 1]AEC32104.1 E3 protein [Raptor adenovirus 1]
MTSPILIPSLEEMREAERSTSPDHTQSCMEALLPLQEKTQSWEAHRMECKAVNCIALTTDVIDVVFLKDYPEIRTGTSVVFCHKFSYTTNVHEKLVPITDNVDFDYTNDCLCITVKCLCTDEFSVACLASNFRILCKTVMQAIDGAYPLSMASNSADSLPALLQKEEKEEHLEEDDDHLLDGFDKKFCERCYSPPFLCACSVLALSKQEFLQQLSVLNLCYACQHFSKMCTCRYRVGLLYKFYRDHIVDNMIPKRMNEVKRLAYLASCNVKVCFNCNRYYLRCVCDADYQILFPPE